MRVKLELIGVRNGYNLIVKDKEELKEEFKLGEEPSLAELGKIGYMQINEDLLDLLDRNDIFVDEKSFYTKKLECTDFYIYNQETFTVLALHLNINNPDKKTTRQAMDEILSKFAEETGEVLDINLLDFNNVVSLMKNGLPIEFEIKNTIMASNISIPKCLVNNTKLTTLADIDGCVDWYVEGIVNNNVKISRDKVVNVFELSMDDMLYYNSELLTVDGIYT